MKSKEIGISIILLIFIIGETISQDSNPSNESVRIEKGFVFGVMIHDKSSYIPNFLFDYDYKESLNFSLNFGYYTKINLSRKFNLLLNSNFGLRSLKGYVGNGLRVGNNFYARDNYFYRERKSLNVSLSLGIDYEILKFLEFDIFILINYNPYFNVNLEDKVNYLISYERGVNIQSGLIENQNASFQKEYMRLSNGINLGLGLKTLKYTIELVIGDNKDYGVSKYIGLILGYIIQ